MAQKERIEKLKNILMKTNGSAIKDLATELEVTEMTVRRDLKKLIDSERNGSACKGIRDLF